MDQTNNIKVTVNTPVDLRDTDIIVQYTGGLTGKFTNFGNIIFEWCADTGVDADLLGSWFDDGYFSAWRVVDSHQRLIFSLKWQN
jgi:hypothetical protein